MKINQALNRVYLCTIIILSMLLLASCSKAEVDNNDEFTFAFFGDIQEDEDMNNRYIVFRSLLKNAFIQDNKPEFIMLAGDIVDDGDDENQWQGFVDAVNAEASGVDFYACVGNHDDTKLQEKYLDISKHDNINGDNSFYSFDYKNVHFVVMDSNLMGSPTEESIVWLENDLKNASAKYKIVMFHHPAYPAIENPKDAIRAKTIRDVYIPIMEKYYVNLVLGGHQHTYMRTRPLKNGDFSDDGIVYLMGVASSKYYVNFDYDYVAFAKNSTPVYSLVTINENEILIKTKNEAGELIDSFEIR